MPDSRSGLGPGVGACWGRWPWPWGACWTGCLEGLEGFGERPLRVWKVLDGLEGLEGFGGCLEGLEDFGAFGGFWRVWSVCGLANGSFESP